MCLPIDTLADNGAREIHRRLGRGPWHWQLLSNSADGQAVFEYTFHQEMLIGKFSSATKTEQSYLALQKLSECSGECLSVPRPIFYDQQLHFLVTKKAAGAACHGMPLSSTEARLNRIGCALRELHACKVEIGQPKNMEDHLQELVRPAPRVLAVAFPQHAKIITETLDLLRAKQSVWKDLPSAALHRDFHLRQLFDSGSQICVVDWDLSAQGDPAFDVAYFTTYLKTHYPVDETLLGIEFFLAGYQPSPELLDRIGTYECFNFLRRACRRYRLKDVGWQKSLEGMLGRLRVAQVG